VSALAAVVVLSAFTANAFAQDLPRIEWDAKRLIEPHGSYGRMVRLDAKTMACAFDRDAKMWVRLSRDDGQTWDEKVLVAEAADCWLTNAELLPLKNGELLYFWNERPSIAVKYANEVPPPGLLKRPFLIRMSRSLDGGRTWSSPLTLYTAGPSYHDGCWEPAAIELATGAIQLFFANEFPYQTTAEQEISRITSTDGGKSWSEAARVSFRPRFRDGMPSPMLLASGKTVIAIEDNGQEDGGGVFKISIVDAATGKRWPALKQPLAPHIYAGAPQLRRLASGHTVLSFQESDDGTVHHCRLAVYIGNASAANFANKSYPLATPTRGNQAWSSLFVKDATTVTAITAATIDQTRGLWAIDGRVRYSK
jgi:hypothetical protein